MRQAPAIAARGLAADLAAREQSGQPIRVGVIGCGEMGTDLVTQIARMQGMRIGAIVDRSGRNAQEAIRIARLPETLGIPVDGLPALDRAIEAGGIAIIDDAHTMLRSGLIDVVIDATGRPAAGAELGRATIRQGKHLVMMNVEADVTIGPLLKREADQAGIVYTIGAGDEPTATMELINFATALGYPVIAAGKGKNNPFNPDAVPDDYRAEAERRNMNPRMLVEFIDGSKTMVEMAAIANATGLTVDVPGMHGPEATLAMLEKVLVPKADGGILTRKGVVDYTVGKGVAPGVFIVVEMDHPRLCERMHDLRMGGEGPYYTFYRPHHLTSLEVPLSAARAVLYGEAEMFPLPTPSAEVCARAKRALAPGEQLDAIGETCYRSFTLTVADARAARAWPVGMLHGGTVLAPIAKGELITRDKVSLPADSVLVQMRSEMDALIWGDA
ncbi:homoserine dehydrogenase [Rhabdaerophilum sp. SD176]|uniref:NAD(P)H-dependent oxidoreductase n=1 Tax=Rhabdaerophilum sp. SD176 TaxID=2983548 RepID=UPI0024DFAE63|nr:homoserine dehydrogenase [Rhabdaerophilum sp. SD176]